MNTYYIGGRNITSNKKYFGSTGSRKDAEILGVKLLIINSANDLFTLFVPAFAFFRCLLFLKKGNKKCKIYK